MGFDTRNIVIAALLGLPVYGWTATVNRCEDERGHITFTTLSCPAGQASRLQKADSPLPGSRPPTILTSTKAAKPTKQPSEDLVIVGQRDDGCGNVLSAEQRRKAIINQQTPTGMTKRDVESLLGKPDKIIGRNSEVRYVYAEKKGRSRQVAFDEHGCVKGGRSKSRP
ncbi:MULTISPECIES: cell envelope protein SmpA [unclassified Pseudomonas]|uniref:cell envelope protein SmpA n=1 Tax=unclassified Pseudomonas TaxID=196821 RepID=UPI000D37511A|nr:MULTISPECIES: cell envelope protein SmpA [unclassified Pseudomonas]RAU45831.1 cell envelope protein SmpA [Pseudomonas sp. RIT 409]RAU56070.1 cell envelope protein SmpA [Pseudomonas sp. RIT 412]